MGGRCCEVSGNDLDRGRGRSVSGSGGGTGSSVCHAVASEHHRRDHLYNFNDDRSSMGSGSVSGGGGGGGGYGREVDRGRTDEPVLSERDRKEFMSLANENISMDFILEMKEAFQLFDKVIFLFIYLFLSGPITLIIGFLL